MRRGCKRAHNAGDSTGCLIPAAVIIAIGTVCTVGIFVFVGLI